METRVPGDLLPPALLTGKLTKKPIQELCFNRVSRRTRTDADPAIGKNPDELTAAGTVLRYAKDTSSIGTQSSPNCSHLCLLNQQGRQQYMSLIHNSILNLWPRLHSGERAGVVAPNYDTPYSFASPRPSRGAAYHGPEDRNEPLLRLPAHKDLYTFDFRLHQAAPHYGNSGGTYLIARPNWKEQSTNNITKVSNAGDGTAQPSFAHHPAVQS